MKALTALLLGLLATPTVKGAIRAGAATEDITPKQWPLHIRGGFVPPLVHAAHDPLHSRAIVLEDGAIRLAIVVVDNCLIDRKELDEAKERATKASGIPIHRMLIAATHTHSAPFSNASNGTPEELAYREQMIQGIADSIVQAAQKLQPARIGWQGQDLTDEVFNRRWFLKPGTMPMNPFGSTNDIVKMNPGAGRPNLINPAGPTDPEVSILSIQDNSGRPMGLLANYSLHYVGSIPGNQVSADYFGEFARLMAVRLRRSPSRDGFVGILSNGTSGDINNIDFSGRRPPREPFEQIRIVAGKVADSAYWAYQKTRHSDQVSIDMIERILPLQVRRPTPEDLTRSRRYLELGNSKEVPSLGLAYARRILDLAEGPDTIEAKIQVIRIGDLAICTFPFETFVEIGLRLKDQSPFEDTFIMELANGAYGYLPTREQHAFGGYETWMGTSRVQFDANEILEKNLLEMMHELKARQSSSTR